MKELTSHRLVEKRRRDRINKSLHELRDIIPKLTRTTQTFKNDKVELLQATIDYLNENGKKTPSQLRVTQHTLKGTQPTMNVTQHTLKGSQPPVNITQPTVNVTQPTVNVTQPTLKVTQPIQDMTMCTQLTDVSNSTIEITSRSDGFRDCMEETIRYLIENEGFPSEHPVILRLRAHLQQRLELCGHNNGQTQLTNHTECISKTIPMIPHGSPAIPTGAVETSDRPLTDIMKPLTIDTRYQYAIPESISQHLTQDSQNNNSTLNRCLISNNSLLAVVPETNGYNAIYQPINNLRYYIRNKCTQQTVQQ
ncbi:uncharacterized protein [Antedon mediterranea]|uniref:uncharacterized protein isoform X2 n=1 Tax=Antedon mediterranea TaxID=105859 RepID=UPI003AF693BD